MKKPTILQTFRRIGQQMQGWQSSFNAQEHQLKLIQKLYANNGLELRLTCGACPEQYDVLKDGKRVAYYRLRHGGFTVEHPESWGELLYEAEPTGDGIFEDWERPMYLIAAMRCVLKRIT